MEEGRISSHPCFYHIDNGIYREESTIMAMRVGPGTGSVVECRSFINPYTYADAVIFGPLIRAD
jgi:hypothetical protein